MAVAQPDFLLVFNEASGKTVTNYGSQASGYSIRSDAACTEGTDFAWTQNAGIYNNSGYMQSNFSGDGGATNLTPWLSTAVTTPGSGLETINVMIAFSCASFASGACYLIAPGLSTTEYNFRMNLANLSGGTFTLDAQFHGGNVATMTQVTGLAINTVHILSASVDVSTPTAAQARFKLNGNSVDAPATVNMNTFQFEDAWPYIMRRSDFTNTFGMVGAILAFAYQRGGSAWGDADLAAINSNPATAIAGWPGAGGFLSRNFWWDNL